MDEYTVGELARLAHVSVRTLHHYDAIGLLTPSGRTTAGYRVYRAEDLLRLRQILFYRGSSSGWTRSRRCWPIRARRVDDHLRKQHQLLRERIEQHRDLLAALEKEMEARKMGISLTPEEQFEVFGTDKVGGEWADEAASAGATPTRTGSRSAATAGYTKQDWERMKARVRRRAARVPRRDAVGRGRVLGAGDGRWPRRTGSS